jgi:hypothetical protein
MVAERVERNGAAAGPGLSGEPAPGGGLLAQLLGRIRAARAARTGRVVE